MQVGINTDYHFETKTTATLNLIGNTLVPKASFDTVMKNPVTMTVQTKADRDDDYKGYVMTTIQPSVKIVNGVYVGVNDHYEAQDLDFSDLLAEQWDKSLQHARDIVDVIRGMGGQT